MLRCQLNLGIVMLERMVKGWNVQAGQGLKPAESIAESVVEQGMSAELSTAEDVTLCLAGTHNKGFACCDRSPAQGQDFPST